MLRFAGLCVLLVDVLSARWAPAQSSLAPVVEAEETVYRFEPANNGAGPMWCSGSTCLVRIQDKLFASGLETLTEFTPLNNCRWTLFERDETGWQLRHRDPSGRTREPCPVVGFANGQLFLSANPTLTTPPETAGPAQPQILRWNMSDVTTAARDHAADVGRYAGVLRTLLSKPGRGRGPRVK